MTPRNEVDSAEAKSIAGLYGIDFRTVVPVGGGFSGACVLRVEDSSGAAFAFRRTPATDVMLAARYCEMVALLRDMASRGCGLIPVPLRHQQQFLVIPQPPHASAFVNFDHSRTRIQTNDGVWQVEPWMPGQPAYGPPTPSQVKSALEALAQLHKAAADSVEARSAEQSAAQWFHVSEERSPGIARRLSIVTELSDGLLARFIKSAAAEPDPEFQKCAKRLCATLEFWLPWLTKQLAEASRFSYRLQPVIRDLWKPHVLFNAERVTGIIDLNAMATDHVGLDVTRLFRSWFGSEVERIREAINQFRAQPSLDEHECRLLEAFDAATVLLSPVTWLRRRFVNSSAECISRDVLDRLSELTILADGFEPLGLSITSASQIPHRH